MRKKGADAVQICGQEVLDPLYIVTNYIKWTKTSWT